MSFDQKIVKTCPWSVNSGTSEVFCVFMWSDVTDCGVQRKMFLGEFRFQSGVFASALGAAV